MSNEKKQIEAGTHKVKVSDWGMRETNAGNLQVYISFSNGATMFQNVNTHETGDEILAKSLVLCGFKGDDLSDLFEDDALDKNTEIGIFIKYKPDSQGKPQMQVFVNDPSKQMKGAIDAKDAKLKMKEMKLSIKANIKIAKSEVKMPERQVEDTKLSENKSATDYDTEEIPF